MENIAKLSAEMGTMTRNRSHVVFGCMAMLWPAVAAGASAGPATRPAPPGFESRYPLASPLSKYAGRAAEAAIATAASGDFTGARAQADLACDLMARYGTPRDVDAVRETAYARRLIDQIGEVGEGARADLLTYLLAHPALSHTMAFSIAPEDEVSTAYELLDRLRRERPAQVDRLPELTVALCVVRDRPLSRHMNENKVTAVDPLDVFDFYASHEGKMYFGLRGVPVEELIHVVDTTASIADLNWALSKYAGTRDVGALFFTVKYDFAYFEGKSEKKVDVAPGGYNLPNILRFGGVCVDQAYFAASVGKAIGVPTAIATANSGEAGHAWVGYLKNTGKTAAWDFNSGRYPEYQGILGSVPDPQIGKNMPDSTVGLVGDAIGTTAVQRQNVTAFTDEAFRLANAREESSAPAGYPPELAGKSKPPTPRPATPEGLLDLIEAGLRQFPAYPRAWGLVAKLAHEEKLSEPQKRKWADLIQRLCGPRHPDFALTVLTPMVGSVADANEQSALWDAVFKLVQARPDLAASVRFHQAKLWQKQRNPARAERCYEDVILHYLNAGPFALRALAGCESVLKEMGQPERVLDLYAAAAKLVVKPSMGGQATFMRESNWYKVREAYAGKLDDAGKRDLAERIRSEDKAG